MKTAMVVFGSRLNMARRMNRRMLVVLVFAGYAGLMGCSWLLDHWRFSSLFLVLVPSIVNGLILGGYGLSVRGMVKPFLANEILEYYARNPRLSWSLSSQQRTQTIADLETRRSDERELHRRDSVHWVAYRCLGGVLLMILFIAMLQNDPPPMMKHFPAILSSAFERPLYGLILAAFLLFTSLPQAILLWTEPDMEPADEVPLS
jgi:hypothetical protein